jgi:hypothetical protein
MQEAVSLDLKDKPVSILPPLPISSQNVAFVVRLILSDRGECSEVMAAADGGGGLDHGVLLQRFPESPLKLTAER